MTKSVRKEILGTSARVGIYRIAHLYWPNWKHKLIWSYMNGLGEIGGKG